MNPVMLALNVASTVSFLSTANSGDTARLRDHDVGFQFMVMIGFGAMGEFQSVDGLQRQVDTETLQEGGRSGGPHVVVKHGKEGTLTLKFGMMDRSGLWDWMEAVKVGYEFRRDVTVVQFNRAYSPVRIWQLTNCFPRRIKSGALDAMSSNMPVDEIELVYERIIPMIIPHSGGAAAANALGAVGNAAGKLL